MQWKLILALVFALLVALFAIQNAQTIDVHFLGFGLSNIPVAGVIIGMLAVGVLLGLVFSAPGTLGRGLKIRELQSQLKHKEEELAKALEQAEKHREEAIALRLRVDELEKNRQAVTSNS